jgi:hypothetical protein
MAPHKIPRRRRRQPATRAFPWLSRQRGRADRFGAAWEPVMTIDLHGLLYVAIVVLVLIAVLEDDGTPPEGWL